MSPVHNITVPGSWSTYDFIDNPLPRKTGVYPDHWSQPTKLYSTLGTGDLIIPAGRILATDLQVTRIENYTYITEIIPSQHEVVLNTANKLVPENIVIKPIPSNYGLITWDGSVLTVS